MRARHWGYRLFTAFCAAGWLACCGAAASAESAGRGHPLYTAPVSVSAAPAVLPAASQASSAAPAPSVSASSAPAADFENQPISFLNAGGRRQARGEAGEYRLPSVWPALLVAAVVCIGFCAALYLMKKYLPGHRQLFSHPAMEVLGRTHLDPRRYVSLLRVGRRIIVVGVTQDDMRPLSEITDEEEITEIMEVARPKSEMGLSLFQRLFQRHVIETEAAEDRAMLREHAAGLEQDTARLRQHVQGVRDGGEPPRHVDRVG